MVAREMLAAGTRGASGRSFLTDREREVLRVVTKGLANKQIAARLGITERAVKAHVGSAFGRIGVSDRTSAAISAQRHLGDDPG
jgi:DNA-binding NarL/FixJ family response regulator